jgi:hypothetical protein
MEYVFIAAVVAVWVGAGLLWSDEDGEAQPQ